MEKLTIHGDTLRGKRNYLTDTFGKDSDDKDEKHLTKRISLIHSTKQTKEDLEIGNKEEQSVFTKEIYKDKKISFVAKFDSDATSKIF